MKTLKFIGIFTLMVMSFSSCNEIVGRLFAQPEPDTLLYQLDLSFQDKSGNDLVKGIGLEEWCCPTDIPEEQAQSGAVKRGLYELGIIFSEPCTNWKGVAFTGSNNIDLLMKKYDNGCYYLKNHFLLFASDCPEKKIITVKLKCPYIFGDEAVHEFVTHWDIPKMHSGFAYPTCNRIEFEGKVITPMTYKDQMQKYVYISYATIILKGRETQF